MRHTVFTIMAILAGTVLAASATAKDKVALNFTELHGKKLEQVNPAKKMDWLGQATLVVFWRSDCAPCLKEMAILPEIAKENPNLPIALISLQDADHVRSHLGKMPENVRVLVAEDDGREALSAFGNDRTLALPYSVMLDAESKVCDWHYGIIAPEKIKKWKEECS